MKSPIPGTSRPGGLAVALLVGALQSPSAMASGEGPTPESAAKVVRSNGLLHRQKVATQGTLGYGPPGPHPGYQGFGLGYHLGYGFGGPALGVGAEGGYPLYGGPGYPHPAPALRRIGGIAPFCYEGGPGGPVPGHPNFYGGAVGPLAPDNPAVTIPAESPYAGGFGPFDGTIPYPESTFAPFATQAAGDAFDNSTSERSPGRPQGQPRPPSTSPSPGISAAEAVPDAPDARGLMGIDTESVVDAGSARGLKVTFVQPSGTGDRAGLKVGDVIRSANGYLTEQPGHLSWVILHPPADKVLTLDVLAAGDGEVHSVKLRYP